MNLVRAIIKKIFFNPVLLLVLVIVAAGLAANFYKQDQDSKKEVERLSNPQEAARQEVQKTLDAVSKLIALPDDETATIATVTDKERLKDQAFFTKAENGDKVLIYPQAKKAFLYRPSTNKVIEVGGINITQQSQTGTQTGR